MPSTATTTLMAPRFFHITSAWARRVIQNSSNAPSESPPRKSPAPASAGRLRRALPWRRTNDGAALTKVMANPPRWFPNSVRPPCAVFKAKNFRPIQLPSWHARNISLATAAPERQGSRRHGLRRGDFAETLFAAVSRGNQGRRRFNHGFLQQLERAKNARQ